MQALQPDTSSVAFRDWPHSPSSRPLRPRPFDVSGEGYSNWTFMSTHFWDEDPQGLWILGLENKGYYFNTGESWGHDPQPPQRALEPASVTLLQRGSQWGLVPSRRPAISPYWVSV